MNEHPHVTGYPTPVKMVRALRLDLGLPFDYEDGAPMRLSARWDEALARVRELVAAADVAPGAGAVSPGPGVGG